MIFDDVSFLRHVRHTTELYELYGRAIEDHTHTYKRSYTSHKGNPLLRVSLLTSLDVRLSGRGGGRSEVAQEGRLLDLAT